MNLLLPSYSNRSVLVLGGTGLIGTHLAHRLTTLGANVTVAARTGYGSNSTGFPFLPVDLRSGTGLETAVTGADVIFNVAGRSGAVNSNTEALADLEVNCRGQLLFLETCRQHNPKVTIVYAGSRLQYGRPQYLPVDETHPTVPRTIYGLHKLAAERYHMIYSELYGLRTISLRISVVYGKRPQHAVVGYDVVSAFISAARRNEALTVFGDGSQHRDYVFVGDVVEAMLFAGLYSNNAHQVFNIGGPQRVSLRQLAELVIALSGGGHLVEVPWPSASFQTETGDFYFDLDLAHRELGWVPETALSDGLSAILHSNEV